MPLKKPPIHSSHESLIFAMMRLTDRTPVVPLEEPMAISTDYQYRPRLQLPSTSAADGRITTVFVWMHFVFVPFNRIRNSEICAIKYSHTNNVDIYLSVIKQKSYTLWLKGKCLKLYWTPAMYYNTRPSFIIICHQNCFRDIFLRIVTYIFAGNNY